MNNKKILLIFIPVLLFVVACDRVVNDPKGDEMARLEAWVQVNHIDPSPTTPLPSGLYYISKKEGSGVYPADSDYVLYSYVLRDLDNTVYETSYKDTATFYDFYTATNHYVPTYKQFYAKVNNLKGLNEGLSLMKPGGEVRLIVPSNLAYGKNGYNSISSYTTLIYDLKLDTVISDPQAYEDTLISKYRKTNPDFINFSDTAYIKEVQEGTRNCIIAKDSIVYVYYTGRYLDGIVFDTNIESVAIANSIWSSSNTYGVLTFTIGAGTVTSGFEFAVKQMMEGQEIIAIIPSKYAYGISGQVSNGTTKIRPYETLIFEIELVNVQPKKE
jgi:FKBP-type peptidyl-prolyl cis-trans isomerase